MRRRRKRGTGTIEVVVAAIVLVPLALALLDGIVLVVANQMNDSAAKNAARAAANQKKDEAGPAAETSLNAVKSSGIVRGIAIEQMEYTKNGSVSVTTRMKVKLPVPFPWLSDMEFLAKSVEPVVMKDDSDD